MSAALAENPAPPSYGRAVALHSLGWLVAANLVGLWLAATLIWPAMGNLAAPLTWGRWAAVHMSWQLYGWCALPLVGALIAWCFNGDPELARRDAQVALGAWSLALGLGGATWLAGHVSGKLFLDWHGWVRPALPLAMICLWVLLTWHSRRQWPDLGARHRTLRVTILGLLLLVPPLLFWASGRDNYHPINPDSGGATGAAVLGSTLGIVTIFMLVPEFLHLKPIGRIGGFVSSLTASWLVFAAIDRGNVSHHNATAIVALGTLLLWIPLLPWFWRRFAWPVDAGPWLRAASAWWALLVVTGWISFLPGVSEAFKFTHALVGHAHLAMAGLVTSVNAAIIVVVTRRGAPSGVFWPWQAGCALYVGSMLVLGWRETEAMDELFRSEGWTQGLLAARFAAGVLMFGASVRWWRLFRRA